MATTTAHSSTRFKKPKAWRGRRTPPPGNETETLQWCLEHGRTKAGFHLDEQTERQYEERLKRLKEKKEQQRQRQDAAKERLEDSQTLMAAYQQYLDAKKAVEAAKEKRDEEKSQSERLDEMREELTDELAEVEAAHMAGEIADEEKEERKAEIEEQLTGHKEARQRAKEQDALVPHFEEKVAEAATALKAEVRAEQGERLPDLVDAAEQFLDAYRELETFEEDLRRAAPRTLGDTEVDLTSALPTVNPDKLEDWIEETRDTFEMR